jgi:adenosine deaminase
MIDAETLRLAPKAELHVHLDGGLRPATVVELAAAAGYAKLPTTDVEALGRWFVEAADSGSLERYLETFAHTVAVMQTREALVRVAAECAEDIAADGVIYAEVCFAPELHVEQGLSLDEVVLAALEGFRLGEARAAAAGRQVRIAVLLTAMRHAARSREIAELVVRHRDHGVVGFDIAGAEAGFPPTRHLDAFEYLRRENCHFRMYVQDAIMLKTRLAGRGFPAQRGLGWRGVQHNQRPSRNARSASGARYLPGFVPRGAVRAIACSLSAGSACS